MSPTSLSDKSENLVAILGCVGDKLENVVLWVSPLDVCSGPENLRLRLGGVQYVCWMESSLISEEPSAVRVKTSHSRNHFPQFTRGNNQMARKTLSECMKPIEWRECAIRRGGVET